MTEGKVYVIGSAQVILPFRAGGVVLCPAGDPAAVSRALEEINAKPRGSLVLITEEAVEGSLEAVGEFEERGSHALMIIPDRPCETSVGLERMRVLVIDAVGVDLISKPPSGEVSEEIKLEEGEG